MSDEPDRIVKLELGCEPGAAVSGAVLLQSEDDAFLTFNAGFSSTAVVEFDFCAITKFGYPNDEAWWGIPRTKNLTYGIFEVLNSSWIRELTALNRHAFPNTPDDTRSRHFLFLFHDSSFECIATGLTVEVFTEPYSQVFSRVAARVLA